MNFITEFPKKLAEAAKGNVVNSTITIMLFFVAFNIVEASIERLFFDKRFEHWLDPVFGCVFIAYAVVCVYACAEYNSTNKDI